MFDKLTAISMGYSRRFPNGDEPFQMMTWLLEECGELAQQVNHFEDTGVKRTKYGEPDKAKMAKEVQDVKWHAVPVAKYYGNEPELAASIEHSYQRLKTEGYIE